MMKDKYKVAIVGATGLVGKEIVSILEEHSFPTSQLELFASEKTAGEVLQFNSSHIIVQELKRASLKGQDIVFFASGREISREFCPLATNNGAVVIDNSSEFRMEETVALVVPEVNPEMIPEGPAIIANPNCSTIQMVVALKPLHDVARLKRVVVSSYQSVSGAGKEATDELFEQVRAILNCQHRTRIDNLKPLLVLSEQHHVTVLKQPPSV